MSAPRRSRRHTADRRRRRPATRGWHAQRRRHSERGQGLIEFAMVVPVFLVLLLGMLEFGLAFNHHLTMEYATREGARAGAAMADGSQKDSTCGGTLLTAANVDPLIVSAVEKVLTSPGSLVAMSRISNITIYKAQANGQPVANTSNVWTYTPAAGPTVPCQTGAPRLDFSPPGAAAWAAASRVTGATPDSLGVSVSYTYQFATPLAGIMRLIGGSGMASLAMTDRTVMALEPTS